MVHVEISKTVHESLCRLKPRSRKYWVGYWSKHPNINPKGKVSIQEVIEFLIFNQKYRND